MTNIRKYTDNYQCITFNRKSEGAIDSYIEYIENKVSVIEDKNEFNSSVKDSEKNLLTVTVMKKIKTNDNIKPIWVTQEIKKLIGYC